jgi:predicted DCC family thiol-disulfide oxidoreductase YuxK
MTQNTDTRVLFNGDCPVCNFEIRHYEAYSDRSGLPIRFDDLNSDALADWDITEDQAARRLYVLHEGALLSGMPAFRVLWQQMPRYHWLARITGWPVIRPVTVFTYDRILAPIIYRWHRRRQAKAQRASR